MTNCTTKNGEPVQAVSMIPTPVVAMATIFMIVCLRYKPDFDTFARLGDAKAQCGPCLDCLVVDPSPGRNSLPLLANV